MFEPGFDHRRVSGEEFVFIFLFAALDNRAAIGPPRQGRLRLEGEPVEGYVRRIEIERAVEILLPRPVEMLGKGEDQVERDVVDPAAAESGDGGADLSGVVCPVHPFQSGIIEALRAK